MLPTKETKTQMGGIIKVPKSDDKGLQSSEKHKASFILLLNNLSSIATINLPTDGGLN